MITHPITNLLATTEKTIFGDSWCGPEMYTADKHVLIAKFDKFEDENGHNVEVYCLPSNSGFHNFKIHVLDTRNFRGEEIKGYNFSLGSGSDMARLAFQMSKALNISMLGLMDDGREFRSAVECFDAHTLKCKSDAEIE